MRYLIDFDPEKLDLVCQTPSGVTTFAIGAETAPKSLITTSPGEFLSWRPASVVTPDGPAKALRERAHACRMLATRSHFRISGRKKTTFEGG